MENYLKKGYKLKRKIKLITKYAFLFSMKNVHFLHENENAFPEIVFVSAEIAKSLCVSMLCSEKLWGLF